MSTSLRRACATALLGLVAAGLAVPALSSPAAAVPPAAEPGCATGAAITESNPDDFAITDFSTSRSLVTVPSGGQVASVRVQTFITHTFPGDLKIELVSPDGRRVTLAYPMSRLARRWVQRHVVGRRRRRLEPARFGLPGDVHGRRG